MERLESAEPVDADAVADIDVRVWVDGPGQPEDRVPAWIRDAIRGWDAPLYRPDRVEGTATRLSPLAADRLDELTCPVLAIGGSLDVSDVVATAEYLERHVPGARSVVWDDVAHMIGMEVPERLSGEILGFLAPLPRWS
jgi:pimeloyl-ACP methyl ester carboxylesterase